MLWKTSSSGCVPSALRRSASSTGIGKSRRASRDFSGPDQDALSPSPASTLAHLDCGSLAVEVQVPTFERDQLRAPDPRCEQQLEQQPVPRVDQLDHELANARRK